MSKTPRPNIGDVAREAGVSNTTVSHALNGKGRVDEETRTRIAEAAQRIGYVPSRAARSLVLGKSDAIGLFLPQVANLSLHELLSSDWYGRIVAGASQAAFESGRVLTLLHMTCAAEEAARLGLDGVILLDPVQDDPRKHVLLKNRLPHVLLGRDTQSSTSCTVCPDTHRAMVTLLEHLLEAGATSIALLTHDLPWDLLDEEQQTYVDWMRAHDMPAVSHTVPISESRTREEIYQSAYKVACAVLSAPNRPRAIIGLVEDFGPAIVAAAESLGLRVPDDLLVSQDSDGLRAQLSRPPITAIDMHPEQQVAAAVALLIEQIQGHSVVMETRAPITLNVRGSTVTRS